MLKPFLKVPCNLQPEEEEKWLREQLKAPLYGESFFFFFLMGFSESTHFSPKGWDFFPPLLLWMELDPCQKGRSNVSESYNTTWEGVVLHGAFLGSRCQTLCSLAPKHEAQSGDQFAYSAKIPAYSWAHWQILGRALPPTQTVFQKLCKRGT